jgi:hypothetical protein
LIGDGVKGNKVGERSSGFDISFQREDNTKRHPPKHLILDSIARVIKGNIDVAAFAFFQGKFYAAYNIKDREEQAYAQKLFSNIKDLIVNTVKASLDYDDIIIKQLIYQKELYINLLRETLTLRKLKELNKKSLFLDNKLENIPCYLNSEIKYSLENFHYLSEIIECILSFSVYFPKKSQDLIILNDNTSIKSMLSLFENMENPLLIGAKPISKLPSKLDYLKNDLEKYNVKPNEIEKLILIIKELKEKLTQEKMDNVYNYILAVNSEAQKYIFENLSYIKFAFLYRKYHLFEEKSWKESLSKLHSIPFTYRGCADSFKYFIKECHEAIPKEILWKIKDFSRHHVDISKISKVFFGQTNEDEWGPIYNAAVLQQNFIFLHFKDHMHAEMQILERLFNKLKCRDELYIGISRLCCNGCHTAIEVTNELNPVKILVRGTHGKTYEWLPPAFLDKVPGANSLLLSKITKHVGKLQNEKANFMVLEEADFSDDESDSYAALLLGCNARKESKEEIGSEDIKPINSEVQEVSLMQQSLGEFANFIKSTDIV